MGRVGCAAHFLLKYIQRLVVFWGACTRFLLRIHKSQYILFLTREYPPRETDRCVECEGSTMCNEDDMSYIRTKYCPLKPTHMMLDFQHLDVWILPRVVCPGLKDPSEEVA
eukprot:4517731-Ditylum_brightwellii.AAC.1